jgi:DNA-binding GntR family transcriptional regulator
VRRDAAIALAPAPAAHRGLFACGCRFRRGAQAGGRPRAGPDAGCATLRSDAAAPAARRIGRAENPFKNVMVQIQDIEHRIREDIVAGELQFGSRITIAELANRYGVSQMPIREALRALHGEGLLVIEPNRGARVRSLDRHFVSNIFDLRCSLEMLIVRQMVSRCTADDLAQLEQIEQEVEANIASGDFPAVLRANRELHRLIGEVAQNPDAVTLLNRHWLLIAALWRRYEYGPERFAGVVDDHRHLLAAIRAKDADAAAMLAGAHVVKAKQVLLARMSEDPQPEEPVRRRTRKSNSAAQQMPR